MFLAALLMNASASFWWNYLPRIYPTYLRATGESFAANIRGRVIGTSTAIATIQLANVMPQADAATKLARSAGAVAFSST
jgi:hypothetical protein